MKCKLCQSENVIKFGFNKLKNGKKKKQKYKCKKCCLIFSNLYSLKGYRKSKRIMARAIDDYNDGKSFYKIAYRIKVSTKTVFCWFQKYPAKLIKLIEETVCNVQSFSSARYIDETELPIRKKKVLNNISKKHEMIERKIHMWAMIDDTTKFLNCFHLSWMKDAEACEAFLKKSLKQQRPRYIGSDGAFAFKTAIDNIFNKGHSNYQKQKVKHFSITKSDPKYKDIKGFNNLIERHFQTVKSRSKVTRRYKKISSVMNLIYMFILNYNFLKPHKTIKMTPADAAGIGLGKKRLSFYDFMEAFGIR